jgi:hypothetical protein
MGINEENVIISEKESNITVKECYHSCPLFGISSDGMECMHPVFESGSPWDRMIITQNNSRGRVPDKCPLRKSAIKIVKNIKLEI